MEENKLITLLEYINDRLSKIEFDVTEELRRIDKNNITRTENIQIELLAMKRDNYRVELSNIFVDIDKDKIYRKFVHALNCVDSQDDYYFALGELYPDLSSHKQNFIERMMAYIWHLIVQTDNISDWHRIDNKFVQGYNFGDTDEHIKSTSELISIDFHEYDREDNFPTEQHRDEFRKFFNID